MSNRIGSSLLILALVLAVSIQAAAKTNGQLPLPLIRTALNNYINYDICWGDGGPHGGMPYRLGETINLSLAVSHSGKKFYLWGEYLRNIEALHQPQLSVIYYGDYFNHHAAISQESYDYYVRGKQNWIMMERKKFAPDSIATFQYTIPSHCVMTFPPSQEKTAMVNNVVNTMTKLVKEANTYPAPLHIVIANFDVDYPRTLVYIEETHEVYGLTLHDITNYFGDTFLKEGGGFNSEVQLQLTG